jgi:large subunit ribosomal protein L7A
MLSELKTGNRLVGIKQSGKAIQGGLAACAYIAQDADPLVTDSIKKLCADNGVRLVAVPTMAEIGRACDINVGAAVAVLLK